MAQPQQSFTVRTETGAIRLMTQEEVNRLVRTSMHRARYSSGIIASPNSNASASSRQKQKKRNKPRRNLCVPPRLAASPVPLTRRPAPSSMVANALRRSPSLLRHTLSPVFMDRDQNGEGGRSSVVKFADDVTEIRDNPSPLEPRTAGATGLDKGHIQSMAIEQYHETLTSPVPRRSRLRPTTPSEQLNNGTGQKMQESTNIPMIGSSMGVDNKTQSYTVNTEAEGPKTMSQKEMNRMIRSSIRRARRQQTPSTSQNGHDFGNDSNKDLAAQRVDAPSPAFSRDGSSSKRTTLLSPVGALNRKFSWSSIEESSLEDSDNSLLASPMAKDPPVVESDDAVQDARFFEEEKKENDLDSDVPPQSNEASENMQDEASVNKVYNDESFFEKPTLGQSSEDDSTMERSQILALVNESILKAHNAARQEVEEFIQEAKRRGRQRQTLFKDKNSIATRDELSTALRESMSRARETAQEDIANKVFALGVKESDLLKIREVVRESIVLASESSQQTMNHLIQDAVDQIEAVEELAQSCLASEDKTHHQSEAAPSQPQDPAGDSELLSTKSPAGGELVTRGVLLSRTTSTASRASPTPSQISLPSRSGAQAQVDSEVESGTCQEANHQSFGSPGGFLRDLRLKQSTENMEYSIDINGNAIPSDGNIVFGTTSVSATVVPGQKAQTVQKAVLAPRDDFRQASAIKTQETMESAPFDEKASDVVSIPRRSDFIAKREDDNNEAKRRTQAEIRDSQLLKATVTSEQTMVLIANGKRVISRESVTRIAQHIKALEKERTLFRPIDEKEPENVTSQQAPVSADNGTKERSSRSPHPPSSMIPKELESPPQGCANTDEGDPKESYPGSGANAARQQSLSTDEMNSPKTFPTELPSSSQRLHDDEKSDVLTRLSNGSTILGAPISSQVRMKASTPPPRKPPSNRLSHDLSANCSPSAPSLSPPLATQESTTHSVLVSTKVEPESNQNKVVAKEHGRELVERPQGSENERRQTSLTKESAFEQALREMPVSDDCTLKRAPDNAKPLNSLTGRALEYIKTVRQLKETDYVKQDETPVAKDVATTEILPESRILEHFSGEQVGQDAHRRLDGPQDFKAVSSPQPGIPVSQRILALLKRASSSSSPPPSPQSKVTTLDSLTSRVASPEGNGITNDAQIPSKQSGTSASEATVAPMVLPSETDVDATKQASITEDTPRLESAKLSSDGDSAHSNPNVMRSPIVNKSHIPFPAPEHLIRMADDPAEPEPTVKAASANVTRSEFASLHVTSDPIVIDPPNPYFVSHIATPHRNQDNPVKNDPPAWKSAVGSLGRSSTKEKPDVAENQGPQDKSADRKNHAVRKHAWERSKSKFTHYVSEEDYSTVGSASLGVVGSTSTENQQTPRSKVRDRVRRNSGHRKDSTNSACSRTNSDPSLGKQASEERVNDESDNASKTMITEELLAKIAKKKGTAITADELNELIKGSSKTSGRSSRNSKSAVSCSNPPIDPESSAAALDTFQPRFCFGLLDFWTDVNGYDSMDEERTMGSVITNTSTRFTADDDYGSVSDSEADGDTDANTDIGDTTVGGSETDNGMETEGYGTDNQTDDYNTDGNYTDDFETDAADSEGSMIDEGTDTVTSSVDGGGKYRMTFSFSVGG